MFKKQSGAVLVTTMIILFTLTFLVLSSSQSGVVQEKMTAQIANCIQDVLSPRGVGVVIEAAHQCMTTRGVHKTNVTMVTSQMLGGGRIPRSIKVP